MFNRSVYQPSALEPTQVVAFFNKKTGVFDSINYAVDEDEWNEKLAKRAEGRAKAAADLRAEMRADFEVMADARLQSRAKALDFRAQARALERDSTDATDLLEARSLRERADKLDTTIELPEPKRPRGVADKEEPVVESEVDDDENENE